MNRLFWIWLPGILGFVPSTVWVLYSNPGFPLSIYATLSSMIWGVAYYEIVFPRLEKT